MKVKALAAVLAKRYGVALAEPLVPSHPDAGRRGLAAGARRVPGGQARLQGRASAPARRSPGEPRAQPRVAPRGVRRRGRARHDGALADDQRRRPRARHRRVEHLAPQEPRARRRGARSRARPAARSPGPCGSSRRRRAGAAAPPPPAAGSRRRRRTTTSTSSSSRCSSSRRIVPFISPSSCRLRPESISLSPIRSRPPSTGRPSGLSAARSRALSASIPSAPR